MKECEDKGEGGIGGGGGGGAQANKRKKERKKQSVCPTIPMPLNFLEEIC